MLQQGLQVPGRAGGGPVQQLGPHQGETAERVRHRPLEQLHGTGDRSGGSPAGPAGRPGRGHGTVAGGVAGKPKVGNRPVSKNAVTCETRPPVRVNTCS